MNHLNRKLKSNKTSKFLRIKYIFLGKHVFKNLIKLQRGVKNNFSLINMENSDDKCLAFIEKGFKNNFIFDEKMIYSNTKNGVFCRIYPRIICNGVFRST